MNNVKQSTAMTDRTQMMESQSVRRTNEEMEIDLLELFQAMLHKLWLIILLLVLGAGVAFGATKLLITPMYTASSEIYILTKTTSVTSLADIQMGAQITSDFAVLATSRPVVENVIKELDLDYTYEQVVSMVSTENPSNTRILRINVENADAELAKDMANAFGEETAERVAYIMTTDKPKVVEEAVTPKSPSSPSVVKNTALGGLLGMVIAMGIITIVYLMNDTIQTEEDVRKYLDLHTLAAVPMEKRR